MHAALQRVIEEVIAPAATEVDRDGTFPRRQVEALQREGILGLTVPTAYGGGGKGLAEAEEVVREIGAVCGSTAMVVTMHFSAAAALVAADRGDVLAEIAAGRHLTTLAFSETGSRSHFWAPLGTAVSDAATDVRLNARKSWVTSAGEADSYVWSSLPAGGGRTDDALVRALRQRRARRHRIVRRSGIAGQRLTSGRCART